MTARTATLAVRAAGVVLALVVWSLTHTVTHLAIAHADADGAVLPGTFVARLALGAAALTLVAFVAAALAGRPGAGVRTRGASLAAPLAFVGAEFVTHVGSEHAAPRLALIGVALGVNALVGAVYQQLWSVGLGRTDRILALLAGVPAPSTPLGPTHTAFRRTLVVASRPGRVTSRGPPRPPRVPSPLTITRPLPLPV